MIKCPGCGELKEKDAFCRDSRRPSGLQWDCRTCSSARRLRLYRENKEFREKQKAGQRRYYAANREKCITAHKSWEAKNPEYAKNKSKENWAKGTGRKWKYGITKEQFDKIVARQSGRCAVCEDRFSEENPPHVDHCHRTNFVRGLICRDCNVAEGRLRTPEIAFRMYQYMENNGLFYESGTAGTVVLS
jgi:hypothetical protein